MALSLKFIWKKNLLRAKTVFNWAKGWLAYHLLPARPLDLSDPDGKPVVLFLGDYIQARIPRMAKWIRRDGRYTCAMMVSKGKAFYLQNNQDFTAVLEFESVWQLRRLLRDMRGVDLIHAFAIPSYHIRPAIERRHDLPVLVDSQDLWASYYGPQSPRLYMQIDMKHEAFVLARADGLVAHSMELFYACEAYEIEQRPPTLFFPLFCDEDDLVEVVPQPAPEEIHLVYAGSIAGSFQPDKDFGNIKFHRLIEVLSAQRIHLHIYPAPTIRFQELILAEYQALADRHPYFHLHGSVSQQELSEILAQYHFGILPFYQADTARSMHKFRRATSQKLFNYLEAGLPVILGSDIHFQHWMARSFGAAIVLDKPEWQRLGQILSELDYQTMQARVVAGRARILLGQHIPQLLAFYAKTITRKKAQKIA
jgi:hypothetical protein